MWDKENPKGRRCLSNYDRVYNKRKEGKGVSETITFDNVKKQTISE